MFLLGNPPDIDEGPDIKMPDNITEGNKRVTIGSSVYVHDGYSVTIDCTTVSGTPPITITWVHNETLIAEDVNSITINASDAINGEIITCRANNSVGFDEEGTTIYVLGNTIHMYKMLY